MDKSDLKQEVIKTKLYQLKVCPECWDPDHPQLQLGMYPINDPQALYQPRPDLSYVSAGLNGLQLINNGNGGYPTGGSRDIQWGWNPIGGASQFDAVLTPNYLVSTAFVGTSIRMVWTSLSGFTGSVFSHFQHRMNPGFKNFPHSHLEFIN